MDEVNPETAKATRNKMVAFILNNSISKTPIKQSDIMEIAEKKTKIYNHCFPLVERSLQEIYGIRIAHFPDTKAGKKFICYSEITAKSQYEYDETQQRHITLLFLILSFIFMTGRPVYESNLKDFLRSLQIDIDSTHSFFGGNLKKLITETFVRQLYLKKEKFDSAFDAEVRYTYAWGFRSTLEFNKKQILETTAKLLGKPSSMFKTQSIEAQENNANPADEGTQEE